MSDVESFGGADVGSEGIDQAAFEKFKERMKAAAAQIKALQASEQRQKKNEDELIKILIKFIKSGQKKELLALILKLLDRNIPAVFILSLILIANKDVQNDMKIVLMPQDQSQNTLPGEQSDPTNTILQSDDPISEMLTTNDAVGVSPAIKQEIATWLKVIEEKLNENPARIIRTTIEDGQICVPAIQLTSFCLREFLQSKGVESNYEKLREFISFVLQNMFHNARQQLHEKKKLAANK